MSSRIKQVIKTEFKIRKLLTNSFVYLSRASEDLNTDLTRSNVMLQDMEAMTGFLTGLDEIISKTGKLPPARGDVEKQPEKVTFPHNDTVHLIMSADPSDLCFAESDNHTTEDRTTSSELKTI